MKAISTKINIIFTDLYNMNKPPTVFKFFLLTKVPLQLNEKVWNWFTIMVLWMWVSLKALEMCKTKWKRSVPSAFGYRYQICLWVSEWKCVLKKLLQWSKLNGKTSVLLTIAAVFSFSFLSDNREFVRNESNKTHLFKLSFVVFVFLLTVKRLEWCCNAALQCVYSCDL